MDLDVVGAGGIRDPLSNIVKEIILNGAVYFLLIAAGNYHLSRVLHRQQVRSQERADDLKDVVARATKDHDRAQAEVDKLSRAVREIRTEHARHKSVYILRIRDLAKELSFWRHTVKQLLAVSAVKAEDLLMEVTKQLRTFHTLESRDFGPEQIAALAEALAEIKQIPDSQRPKPE